MRQPSPSISHTDASVTFLRGGGDMGAHIRTIDWSQTSIGAPDGWPLAIRSSLSTMLSAPQQMFLAWGPDLTFLFNDAFRPLLGERLAGAIGRPFAELWADFWPEIEPIVTKALAGEGSRLENLPLISTRNGVPEPTWWSFSYMPLRDEFGDPIGMFCVVEEASERVLAQAALRERELRQQFRIELSDALRGASDAVLLTATAAEILGRRLKAGCVGFAVADATGELVTVSQDWTASDSPSIVGTHRLADFGAAVIDELRAGRSVRIDEVASDPLTRATSAAFFELGVHALIDAPLIRNGEFAGLVFVLNPVSRAWTDSEFEMVEEAAERTWAELQRLQAEEALRQSDKLKAMGQLVGGVAHDFNNLLTPIIGGLDMLLGRGTRDARDLRLIDSALQSAERAKTLVQRLLAFARRQPLQSRATRVSDCLCKRRFGSHSR